MSAIRLLVCAALFGLSILANAEEFSGKVIAVMDGDTLLVLKDGQPVKVRLAEIDAPEKAQPFGMASQKSLAEMVKGRQVRIGGRAVDDYGRLVATIRVGEIDVSREQVRRGMAWEYSRFHSNRELVALQREAQQAKRGLWAGEASVEPSQWRKQHPATMTAPIAAAFSHVPAAAASSRSDPALQLQSGQDCSKKHCSEMSSCDEARYYLSVCGKKALDGNADGIPCERLCAPTGDKTPNVQ